MTHQAERRDADRAAALDGEGHEGRREPETATEDDRRRSARIERLVERFRRGRFSADNRGELNQLIDADYQAATARADRFIRAKQRRARSGNGKPARS